MSNQNIIISGRVDVPNLFFTRGGESYIGEYTVQTAPFRVFALPFNQTPFQIFFRNSILLNPPLGFPDGVELLENEVLSKNFENTKYKIEKIIKFTNSK